MLKNIGSHLNSSEWIIWGILIISILSLIILYINYRGARKNAKNLAKEYENLSSSIKELNEELQKKTRQISSMSLHLMTVDDNIEKFVEKTSNGRQDVNKVTLEIRQFYRELKNTKRSLESMKFCFNNMNSKFFDKIEKQYPAVSKQDLKLLAFLKMNLTNKEISNVMNVTTGAVFQSKRRLKKKLGLSPEEKLSKFLERFEHLSNSHFSLN
ncbi:helix-turn-helix transcriptional regulator [Ekhidna sp.]